jgi:hypothetical protein
MATSMVLKLLVTPLLIGGATLAGRRWGDRVSGWLVGLPLTSGPVVLFLAVDQGSRFASMAALGVLLGTISQAAFAVTYARLAARAAWPIGAVGATMVFAAATLGLRAIELPAAPAFALVTACLIGAMRLMPEAGITAAGGRPPAWDLPLRIVLATALVLLLTGAAPAIGPRLSGLLSPFPVYAGVLAVFAHRRSPTAAVEVLKGLLVGLFAFAAFFLVLALGLDRIGTGPAFLWAVTTAIVVQGLTLAAAGIRRAGGGP